MKKTLLLAPIVAALLCSASVIAHPQEHPVREVLKQLDLSVQQKQDVRALMQQTRQDGGIYKQDMQVISQQLNRLIHSDNFDLEQAKSLISQRQALQSQISYERAKNRHAIWSSLDQDQQKKLEQLIADKKTNKKQDRKHRGQRGERNPMRALSQLDLNEQQTASIEQIINKQQQQNKQLMSQIKQVKQAEASVIHSDNFSQDAWQAISQQAQAFKLQLAMNNSQSRNQIWNLLDDSQQQKLEQMQQRRMQKWQDKHQRRRDAM